MRPLDYGQVCPLFFLWLELTAVKVFGFSEWSLRLIPTVCSVASVFLFAHMARRVTAGLRGCWPWEFSPWPITRSGTAPRSSSTRRTCWRP